MVNSIKTIVAFALVAISLIITSCEKETETPLDATGRDFMPLEIGNWVLYNVDSVYWDDFTKTMYPKYSQQRYQVVDTFRDGDNRLSYTINVYQRASTTDEFRPDRVMHVTPDGSRLEWSDKNVTLIPLVFPVENGKTWDGTALVSNEDPALPEYYTDQWQMEYMDKNQPFDADVKYYDKTVTVLQINDTLNDPDVAPSAYAYKNYSKEIYAAGVGLVKKERIYWVFQPAPGGSGYRKGYGVTMIAVDYGKD